MLKGLCFGTRAGSPGSKHLRKYYLDAVEGVDPWYETDRDLVPKRLPSARGPLCWCVGLQVSASAPIAVACSGKKFPFIIHNHLFKFTLDLSVLCCPELHGPKPAFGRSCCLVLVPCSITALHFFTASSNR